MATKARREASSYVMGEAAAEAAAEPMAPAARGEPVEPVIWPIPVIIRVVSITRRDTAIARIVVVARRAGVLGGRGLCSRRWRAAKHDGRSVFSGRRLSVGGIRTADHDCCRDGGGSRRGLHSSQGGAGQCTRCDADAAYQQQSFSRQFSAVHRRLLGRSLRSTTVTSCLAGASTERCATSRTGRDAAGLVCFPRHPGLLLMCRRSPL